MSPTAAPVTAGAERRHDAPLAFPHGISGSERPPAEDGMGVSNAELLDGMPAIEIGGLPTF